MALEACGTVLQVTIGPAPAARKSSNAWSANMLCTQMHTGGGIRIRRRWPTVLTSVAAVEKVRRLRGNSSQPRLTVPNDYA